MATTRLTALDPVALRAAWDRQQEFHIPEREVRFQVMLQVLDETLPSRARVLDLGCGTGSLSERVVRRFPHARVWAVDFDPVLLRIGREGLGNVGGRLHWVETDLRRPGWAGSLPPGRFDAAVSTTALHWLTARELRQLFRELARLLRPGGAFLNGDGMPFDYSGRKPEYPRISRIAGAIRASHRPTRRPRGVLDWEEWWKNVETLPALRSEVTERRRRYPRAHETVPPPSAAWQIAELRRVGFHEAAVVWQEMTDRVLLAVR